MQKSQAKPVALPDSRRSSHVGNAFDGPRDCCFHILSASFLALALRRIRRRGQPAADASFDEGAHVRSAGTELPGDPSPWAAPAFPRKRRMRTRSRATDRRNDAREPARPRPVRHRVTLIERQRDQSESAAVSSAHAQQRPRPCLLLDAAVDPTTRPRRQQPRVRARYRQDARRPGTRDRAAPSAPRWHHSDPAAWSRPVDPLPAKSGDRWLRS
jgi:hypothetical protein